MNLFKVFHPQFPACDATTQSVTGGVLTPEREQYLRSVAASVDTNSVLANLLASKGNK